MTSIKIQCHFSQSLIFELKVCNQNHNSWQQYLLCDVSRNTCNMANCKVWICRFFNMHLISKMKFRIFMTTFLKRTAFFHYTNRLNINIFILISNTYGNEIDTVKGFFLDQPLSFLCTTYVQFQHSLLIHRLLCSGETITRIFMLEITIMVLEENLPNAVFFY